VHDGRQSERGVERVGVSEEDGGEGRMDSVGGGGGVHVLILLAVWCLLDYQGVVDLDSFIRLDSDVDWNVCHASNAS